MNRKVLSTATKELNKAKAPAKPKDIFFDPSGMGMLNPNYAGKPVRLATDTLYNPTKYKIRAYADNGVSAELDSFDTTDVNFSGAKYVDEYPQMQNVGIYMDGDLSQEEIDYYAKGGYVIEDISVPELTKAQKGKTVKPFVVSEKEEKIWEDAYNKKYPPIILNDPNDPRIGWFTKEGNKYIYVPLVKKEILIKPTKNQIVPGKVIRKPGDPKYTPYKKEGGALLTKKVTCKTCGWKWDAADGGDDITTCHKCGGQGLVHAQDGGMTTTKSKNGTVTNTIKNQDGSKTIQVKTKEGNYYEKEVPMDYWKELDKLKEEYKYQKDYENTLDYAGVVAYPAAVASSIIDASEGKYGEAALGLIPFAGKSSRAAQLLRRKVLNKAYQSGLSNKTAQALRKGASNTLVGGTGVAQGYDVVGFENGGITSKLSKKEIQELVEQGYVIEEQ